MSRNTQRLQPVVLCVPAEWAVAGPTDADLDRLGELGISHLWLRDSGAPTPPIDHLGWLADWAAGPDRGLIVDRTLARDRRRVGGQPLVVASWQGTEVDLSALAAGGEDQLLRQASSAPVVRMGLRQALLDQSPSVLVEAATLCRGSELVWLDDEVRARLETPGDLELALSLLLSLPGVPCLGWCGRHGTDEGPVSQWPVGLPDAARATLAERIRMRRSAGVAGQRCVPVPEGEPGRGGGSGEVVALRYETPDGVLVTVHDLAARTSSWEWAGEPEPLQPSS
jgi:hypothetical protein